MDLAALRSLFPHTAELVYVNNAATGPLARPTIDAMQAYLDERHQGAVENFEDVLPLLGETRATIARVLHTLPERIAFVPNTSYGLNVLAEGFPWQPGDRVALPGCEFPANVYPFMNQRDKGVEVDLIPHEGGVFSLEDVAHTLTSETRVLSVSWVQFLSGFRADLEALRELCDAHNVLLCVDAIQGLGALTLDVESLGIDFLSCGGHKWLMAPQGTGFLYVTEEVQQLLRPQAGWLHGPVDWEDFLNYELAFYDDARRYHLGTMNTAGFLGLRAALQLYLETGPAWCQKQVLSHARFLRKQLVASGFELFGSPDTEHESGITTVNHPDADLLLKNLHDCGITASVRNRKLRLSPSWYTTQQELAMIVDVLSPLAVAASQSP